MAAPTKYDLGLEYLGGVAKPTVEQVGLIPVVRLDQFGDPVFRYESVLTPVADDSFATTLAPHLRGVGLKVDASGNLAVRERPRRPRWKDLFCTGGVTSGTIGELGWNLLGIGTPTFSRPNVTGGLSNGSGQLSVSSSINDWAALSWGNSASSQVCVPSDFESLQFVVAPLAAVTNRRFFCGLTSDLAVDPLTAVNALGVGFDSGVNSGRWFSISRIGSVGSPVDLTVSPSPSVRELVTLNRFAAGQFEIRIGNTQRATYSAVTTETINLGIRLQTLAAAGLDHRIAGFCAQSALTGAFDDDDFLEA